LEKSFSRDKPIMNNLKNKLLKFPQNRVWRTYPGGKVLDLLANKPEPKDDHFPEDWIGSTTRAVNPGRENITEGLSTVEVDGQDYSFKDILDLDPSYFLGADHIEKFGPNTMVLTKFLDSAIRLHFQCHPTAQFAQKHLGSPSGKAEAYHILAIRDGVEIPYVYLGFQRPPEKQQLKQWIETQDIAAIESCFDKIRVKPGDTLFIPGGFPHAIGDGVFMIEIMEPSDLAVRFEFERGGYVLPESARFLKKGLDFCLDVFEYGKYSEADVRSKYMFEPQKIRDIGLNSTQYHLIGPETTPCYTIRKSEIKGTAIKSESSFYIGIISHGSCTIRTSDQVLHLKQYDKFFCPHGIGEITIESESEATIVETYPPQNKIQ
jgi:mannose-6-phosphate isomerase